MIILRRRVICSFETGTHRFQIFRGIKSIISMTIFYQLFSILAINGFALTLTIWAILSANMRAFIRVQSTPFQTLNNIFFRTLNITALVGIFNAQDEITFMLPGE